MLGEMVKSLIVEIVEAILKGTYSGSPPHIIGQVIARAGQWLGMQRRKYLGNATKYSCG
jgi:hypothetical protein